MKIGSKVYVCDWGKQYTDIYRWINGERQSIWNWKTEIPDHSSPIFHHKFIHEDNLTLKGTINKREPKKLVDKTPVYKNFEYTIEEITTRKETGKLIYLMSSKEGCWVQVGEDGVSTLTPEEQEKVKHLEKEKSLQALAKQNLGKWSINDDLKNKFPKELIKYLYDRDQRTCFGSNFPNTKAIIRYPYVSKEYTKNGNDICLGWHQNYNGIGCDLSDKKTISWKELPARFPENKFKG